MMNGTYDVQVGRGQKRDRLIGGWRQARKRPLESAFGLSSLGYCRTAGPQCQVVRIQVLVLILTLNQNSLPTSFFLLLITNPAEVLRSRQLALQIWSNLSTTFSDLVNLRPSGAAQGRCVHSALASGDPHTEITLRSRSTSQRK